MGALYVSIWVRFLVGLDNADSCDFEGRVILRIVKQSHELAMREIEGNRDIVCLHLGEGCGSPQNFGNLKFSPFTNMLIDRRNDSKGDGRK